MARPRLSTPPAEGATAVAREAVRAAGALLPAQGPLSSFVHHNPLHHLEHLPFEEAVKGAADLYGTQPFLSEAFYRAELKTGRISAIDLEQEVRVELKRSGDVTLGCGVTRGELWQRLLALGRLELSGPALTWHLAESPDLLRFRVDLSDELRAQLEESDDAWSDVAGGGAPASALWAACLDAIQGPAPTTEPARVTASEVLGRALKVDVAAQLDAVLIRFVSAFLDQGLAASAMPMRSRGLFECFLALYSTPTASVMAAWGRQLRALVRADRFAKRDAWTSLTASLEALGATAGDFNQLVREQALALPGWAGMVYHFEVHPESAPAVDVPCALVEYLAIRFLLLRAVCHHYLRRGRGASSLSELLREWRAPVQGGSPSAQDRAWSLFQSAQLLGLSALAIRRLRPTDVAELENEVRIMDSVRRRAILHRAYERQVRSRFFDALSQHEASPIAATEFQVFMCLDEREESFRRHLEERAPRCETFGTAGFFGLAIRHHLTTEARSRALCPPSQTPSHFLSVEPGRSPGWVERLTRGASRLLSPAGRGARPISRGQVVMSLLAALVGPFYALGLLFRILSPRSFVRLRSPIDFSGGRPRLRVALPETGAHAEGLPSGYTVEEMAGIVAAQLRQTGAGSHLAPLVLVLGHGATSQNNPHRGVYECGACGGSAGGPNARAFAAMANDPGVRSLLAQSGLELPEATWFVGGQRNTTSNDVEFYDLDTVPERTRLLVTRVGDMLTEVRSAEAHERCRRFETFPPSASPSSALRHVRARSRDIAQPRPEYGHATNAFCVVGRRQRTRGLFLDRRSFLVSFDPTQPNAATTAGALLSAVVPVVTGINLEYFFGRMDPVGYGCGTKLPHNVAALLGVMDGTQSDLRTGLHWQTLELHEPVRLTVVVELAPEELTRIMRADRRLHNLVRNEWMVLAALSPDDGRLWTVGGDEPKLYTPRRPLETKASSPAHYTGRRDHLPFVRLSGEQTASAGQR